MRRDLSGGGVVAIALILCTFTLFWLVVGGGIGFWIGRM